MSDGWAIRAETPEDAPAIERVHREAFGGEVEVGLVTALRGSPDFIPELSLVAVEQGHVVGHVLFSRAELRTANETREILVLGPVGVLPEWQRRGIGSQLIREGLDRAVALGYSAVALLGHPEYYPRFGFRPGKEFGLRSPFPAPDDVFMALPLSPGALDGAGGLVVYPEPFMQL